MKREADSGSMYNTVPAGGFIPCSMNNFPGRVAAVIFTSGCNFRCPFCHNGHLIDGSGPFYDMRLLLENIASRRKLLDGVVITGGEPTLHDKIDKLFHEIKEMGLDIKLDTNGSRPEHLHHLLASNLVDFVAMDIKAPLGKYSVLSGVRGIDTMPIMQSISLIASSGVEHVFRTTVVKKLLSDDDIQTIRNIVPHGSPHLLQPFNSATALQEELRNQ